MKIKYLLWVSLQNLEGVLESLKDGIQCLSSLCYLSRLSKGLSQRLILVYLVVKLKLKAVLGFSHEEVSD